MSKKKHQREPNDQDGSSDSGDENQNNNECSHINRGVDLAKVKKAVAKTGFLTDCESCKNVVNDPEFEQLELELDLSLWLCLKCGNQACGRGKNMHALKHFDVPHSDCHAVCVNTTIWSIWCYGCDNEVNVTSKKKLLEAIEYLKKQQQNDSNKIRSPQSSTIAEKVIDVVSTLPSITDAATNTGASPKQTSSLTISGLPRARGLANLGNTCFFNSVMQCLGQTPYLVELLDDTAKSGQHFELPGGQLKLKDNVEIELPPLEGETEKWRQLTQTLAETLHELQNGRSEVYNPRNLLQKLICKLPQFGGGDQHDSHELLRHLLEAVRDEDQKRFKVVILEKLGYSSKTDPATVDEQKKQTIKFYGQQVSEMLVATEQVFRGSLVSTLQCQVCGHLSHREEKFLDLSLPICERQLAPILRRKAEDVEYNTPSKHQIKKEKKMERKKKKQKQTTYNNKNVNTGSNRENDDVSMDHKSDSEDDADVEDNTAEDVSNYIIALPAPGDEASIKESESGYNSEKMDNSSSPEMDPLLDNDSRPNVELELIARKNEGKIERSSLDEKNVDIKDDLEKLSLLNDGDSTKVDAVMNSPEGGACAVEVEDELMDQDDDCDEEDPTLYEGTLAPRYHCEEGECSVESCLNQFTECELLMGSNKVACDVCTKRANSKTSVCTDASKQLLIYNPPAVLILHLKRFQVYRFRSAKVSRLVKFSTQLDLGPFCSKRSQSLPTLHPKQTNVLYSLYGVVEHSGSINGGHYVAYVKIRHPFDSDHPRWNFIPRNQKEKLQSVEQSNNEDPQSRTGKWFYISDSYVSEVPESKVLGAQAYLLFYERVL